MASVQERLLHRLLERHARHREAGNLSSCGRGSKKGSQRHTNVRLRERGTGFRLHGRQRVGQEGTCVSPLCKLSLRQYSIKKATLVPGVPKHVPFARTGFENCRCIWTGTFSTRRVLEIFMTRALVMRDELCHTAVLHIWSHQ